MNPRHVLGLLIPLLPLAGCGSPAPEPAAGPPAAVGPTDSFREQAGALTKSFAESLRAELSRAMAEGGPALAIPVCSEKAPAIAAEASESGLTIRRVGTRVRNARTNVPTEAERAVLDRLSEADPEFVGELDGSLTYMRAIFIQEAVCLNCHGSPDVLHPDAPEQLARLYPDDEAIGYALGDKRGAFVVKRLDDAAAPQGE